MLQFSTQIAPQITIGVHILNLFVLSEQICQYDILGLSD